jgi:hypothetical protein
VLLSAAWLVGWRSAECRERVHVGRLYVERRAGHSGEEQKIGFKHARRGVKTTAAVNKISCTKPRAKVLRLYSPFSQTNASLYQKPRRVTDKVIDGLALVWQLSDILPQHTIL